MSLDIRNIISTQSLVLVACLDPEDFVHHNYLNS